MSLNRGRPNRPQPAHPSHPHGDRVILTSALALVVFALGLVPFYFLTPVHSILGGKAPPVQTVVARLSSSPTPTVQTTSVVDQAVATTVSVAATVAPGSPVPLPTSSANDARFAFVLLGYGGAGHDGAYLTDSIMVAIVDPGNKSLTLVSVPRDSWVPMQFDGKTAVYNKINTAYAFAKSPDLYPDRLPRYQGDKGAGTFSADTLSHLLGIPINYYLALDFQGFRDMIDAVGGIDVNVPTAFAARYPANDDPSVDASWKTVQFRAGQQHMDGEKAIEYARARETIDDSGEGSDFARSRRQRLIIEAFKNRMFQPAGLVQLPRLVGIVSQHVDTNYALPAVTALSQLVLDWKDVRIYQTAITADNYLEVGTGPEGTYILIPREQEHSWSQIHAFMQRLWKDPASGVAMAGTTVSIENDGASSAAVSRIQANLVRLGYHLGPTVDGPSRDVSRLVDGTGGTGDLAGELTRDLAGGSLDVLQSTDTASGDVVIQVGLDVARFGINVPTDRSAPLSNVGVVKFGIWSNDPLPTPTPIYVAPVQPIVVESPTPRATPIPTRIPVHATPIPVSNNSTVVVVPSLVGLSEADAQRVINESDLMTTYVNYQTQNDVADRSIFLSVPPGAVLSQMPPPGTKVPRGSRISLAVRKG